MLVVCAVLCSPVCAGFLPSLAIRMGNLLPWSGARQCRRAIADNETARQKRVKLVRDKVVAYGQDPAERDRIHALPLLQLQDIEMSSHKKMNGKFIGKKKRKIEKKWKKEEGANTNDSKGKPSSSTAKHSPLVGHESDQKWYESQFDEVRAEGSATPSDELVQRAQKRGEELLSRDIARFAQSYRSQNRADADWLEMVANRGTFPDRLSALQLRIRRSAVHALPQLRQFVQLAQRKGAKIRQTHTLTKALKYIFLRELLPPSRKLVTLSQRPLEQWVNPTANNKSEADKRLLMWHFEAELKQLYPGT
ncbi:hypothetical protein niasHT_032768 [Heterodera trifolii]|uniref:Uncharacterized protein n=1 Tax=Heterodera trifolii TaxID=157864 RepID=A0ABD2IE41_9BILA